MSSEIRDVLKDAAARPSSPPDLAAIRRRGRRLMWQRRIVASSVVVAIAIGGWATSEGALLGDLFNDRTEVTPVGPSPRYEDPPCRPQDLDLLPRWSEAASQYGGAWRFVNVGEEACVLDGSPRGELVDESGRVLLRSDRNTPSSGSIVVNAGESAEATVLWSNWCRRGQGPFHIRILLPQGGSLEAEAPGSASCSAPSRASSNLMVGSFAKSSGDDQSEPERANCDLPPPQRDAQTVVVYLLRDVPGPSDFAAAERSLTEEQRTRPLHTALMELLKGPTPEERRQGCLSIFSQRSRDLLRGVTVVEDQAIVDLYDFGSTLPGVGTATASANFLDQLSLTVFEFPDIRSIRFEVEGSCDGFFRSLEQTCRIIGAGEYR
ncbi:MAG: DUF4232 domain-containing protein [Actinobacteria bacterium]|nr:DUF4232 domain-containing protein [Actinomycetota bacterium]